MNLATDCVRVPAVAAIILPRSEPTRVSISQPPFVPGIFCRRRGLPRGFLLYLGVVGSRDKVGGRQNRCRRDGRERPRRSTDARLHGPTELRNWLYLRRR